MLSLRKNKRGAAMCGMHLTDSHEVRDIWGHAPDALIEDDGVTDPAERMRKQDRVGAPGQREVTKRRTK